MTTIEAYAFLNFLNVIAPKTKGVLAYRVAKNIRILKTELTEYNEARNGLFSLYGEDIGNGQMRIKDECVSDYLKDLEPINNEPIICGLVKVDEDVLSSSELNAEEMLILMEHMGD